MSNLEKLKTSICPSLLSCVNNLLSNSDESKSKVLNLLKDLGEASTAEIIEQASKLSGRCKDLVPVILVVLEKEKKVSRRISKEKKAIIWTFIKE